MWIGREWSVRLSRGTFNDTAYLVISIASIQFQLQAVVQGCGYRYRERVEQDQWDSKRRERGKIASRATSQ